MGRKQKHEITKEIYTDIANFWLIGISNADILEILKDKHDFQYSIAKVSQMLKEMKDGKVDFDVDPPLGEYLEGSCLPKTKPKIEKKGGRPTKEDENTEKVLNEYNDIFKVNVHNYDDIDNFEYGDENEPFASFD